MAEKTEQKWTGGRLPVLTEGLPMPWQPQATGQIQFDLAGLRDLLENEIIRAQLAGRQPCINADEPLYVAYGHYLATIAEIGCAYSPQKWQPIAQALRGGGLARDFSYVGLTAYHPGSRNLAHPGEDWTSLEDSVEFYGPPEDQGETLDLALLRKPAEYGPELRLIPAPEQKKKSAIISNAENFGYIDDGRIISLVADWIEPDQTIEDYAQTVPVRGQIWRRLLRDSLHGIPPRPLIAGSLRIEAEQLVRDGVEACVHHGISKEQAFVVAVAALRGLWPGDALGQFATHFSSARGEAFWRVVGGHLPKDLRARLPAELLAPLL